MTESPLNDPTFKCCFQPAALWGHTSTQIKAQICKFLCNFDEVITLLKRFWILYSKRFYFMCVMLYPSFQNISPLFKKGILFMYFCRYIIHIPWQSIYQENIEKLKNGISSHRSEIANVVRLDLYPSALFPSCVYFT
jgi:hypothetical protein